MTNSEIKPMFKLIPWCCNLHEEPMIKLLQYFDNEGYDVEICVIEDRDNGTIPQLWVRDYYDEKTRKWGLL